MVIIGLNWDPQFKTLMIYFYSLSSGYKCIHSLFPINLGFLFNLLMILWGKDSNFIDHALKTITDKTH